MMNPPSWANQQRISAQVRLQQFLYRKKTSAPFLSGDMFASLCDVRISGTLTKNLVGLKSANSIFCQSDFIEDFLNQQGDHINATILVLGNSDRDFYEFELSLPHSIKKVFLQNSHLSNDLFENLPIGLENLRYGRNGIPKYFADNYVTSIKQKNILVGPLSPTHQERKELLSWAEIKDSRISFLSDYRLPSSLALYSAQFKFVACPRGNGTDTHRFWETLYRGSIPVVKRSIWSESIEKLGIPLIQLTNWNFEEFLSLSEDFNEYEVVPRKIPSLWNNYWESNFQLGSN